MVKLWGRIGLAAFMAVALILVSACSDDTSNAAPPTSSRSQSSQVTFSNDYNKDDTWLVYWYLCGTDLESDGGAATAEF